MVVGIFAATPLTASAERKGQCGDHAYYKFDDFGILTISGTGAIYDRCFANTTIVKVNIKDSVEGIGQRAFASCLELVGIMMADSVKSIGDRAFESCSKLTNASIGSGVTTIGNSAFRNCTSIKSITIPDSVTTIGSGAFYGCTKLDGIFGVTFVRPNESRTLKIGAGAFVTSKMSYSGDSGYMLYDGETAIDEKTDLTTLNGKTLTWKLSVPGTPSVGVDPTEQPSGDLCKWDNTYHGNTLWGKVIYCFHTILYFFSNLFGGC